jgi:hypothetical protein
MPLKEKTILLGIIIAAGLVGYAVRVPHNETNATIDRGYIDLQPEWRVRVVTPILTSGTYKMQTKGVGAGSDTVVLKTDNDFVGYEIDYHTVNAQDKEGIIVRFGSAEVRKNGRKSNQVQPLVPLFDLPESIHYVRLLFLTRVSPSEHNEAILGASSLPNLDLLTRTMESSPADNCKIQPEGSCSWVPEGISVQAEKKGPKGAWVPAT